MRLLRRKSNWFAAGSLLICGGIGAGLIADSLTGSAITWRRPVAYRAMTEPAVQVAAIDQGAAGRSWAQTAHNGGLRRCPPMNAAFLAACEAEMKALAARPNFNPGSYGGPLLVTTYEPAIVEEPAVAEPEPLEDYPEPELLDAGFERTPDNYPALPQDKQEPS